MRTALLANLLFWIVLVWAVSAHADCRMMGTMYVCDNGQAFQRMGEDLIVDDQGHAWVRDGDTVYLDQAYPAPFLDEVFRDEDEEWSDQSED